MQPNYWLDRWTHQELGFNQEKPNVYLQKYLPQFHLSPKDKIFVPLCGKSIDMYWLMQQGHPILGIELSELACKSFFEEQHLCYEQVGNHLNSPGISLIVDDFFSLKASDVADISLVYDRAALIALPKTMRRQYAHHMSAILKSGTKMLLITFSCPTRTEGPPFAVDEASVYELYGEAFDIQKLHDSPTDMFPDGSNQIYHMLKR